MNNKKTKTHQPRKRFGQNFLHDQGIIAQIVNSIGLNADDFLLEIGAGMGALTEPLLAQVNGMTVIEIDTDLARSLRIRIGANAHNDFTIIENNAMQVDYRQIWQDKLVKDNKNNNKKLRIVGNLPYNISTPLLFHLLTYSDVIQDMHFMLQKEVVDRITAEVGTKQYGRLSVIMQYYCRADYLLTVPKGAFNPSPKVTSAVFRLTPYQDKQNETGLVADDEDKFAIIVRECFNHRRKTLRAIFKKNALLPTLSDGDFATLSINPQARPETLGVAEFIKLSNFCSLD
ncbi:MAG: 16S rRNA (adenine(1518)-N(6)/adenine(1519)-N(6))-dimethyltransferase RsmA [Moraxellaceae bacterium]|nr:16S rRNA (adenine(1518)-N(6)/adenine(1519)-N(6))-dimethyltransferase RsmA [Moraxellaceae bacterium]